MGLRDTINQKPGVITGVTVGVIVVALALIIYTQRSNRPAAPAPGERPVYVPPTQDKPVDVAPPADKSKATKPPGRAALARPRKILVSAPAPSTTALTPNTLSTRTEILG